MANPRRSNWADISDSDSSDEVIVQTSKPKEKEEPVQELSQLERQLQSLSPPIAFTLGNLKYSIASPEPLLQFFGLSQGDCEIQIIFRNNNQPAGSAMMTVFSMETAIKVASFDNQYLETRPIRISLRRSHENTRGRRGGRGNRGGRGRNSNNFFNERGKISIPRGKNNEEHSKPIPKANPFGDAKPIDTFKKDIEFEMKLQSQQSEEVAEEHYHVRKTSYKPVSAQQLSNGEMIKDTGKEDANPWPQEENPIPENSSKLQEPSTENKDSAREDPRKAMKKEDEGTKNKNSRKKEEEVIEEIKEHYRKEPRKKRRDDDNRNRREERKKEREEQKLKEEEKKVEVNEETKETKETRIQRAWTDYDTTVAILSGNSNSVPQLERKSLQHNPTHQRKRGKDRRHFNRKRNA